MPNEQLLTYIKEQQILGTAKEAITSNLKTNGWSESDINSAYKHLQGSTTYSKGAKSHRFLTVITLAVLCAIAMGLFVYQDHLKSFFAKTEKFEKQNPSTPIGNMPNGTVLVLIEDALISPLSDEIENYGADIKKELGLSIETKPVLPTDTVHTLKQYVLDLYKNQKLAGVLLVGNVPTANMYHPDVPVGVFTNEGYVLGDYIYQDILDACVFSPEKNAFSHKNRECQVGTTLQPYWVARLTPNSSDTSNLELLKAYFKRNHEFRNGLSSFEPKMLAYLPIVADFKGEEKKTIDAFTKSLSTFDLYPTGRNFVVDIFSPSSDATYLSELPKKYETLYFNGHGAPTFHQKNIIPKLNIDSRFFLAIFSSCSVGRFTTKDYIAGEYLFSGGLILEAASTPVYGSTQFNSTFYQALASGLPFFEASALAGVGGNILGDPTLKMRYVSTSNQSPLIHVSTTSLTFTEEQSKHEFRIENKGNRAVEFRVETKYHKQKYIELLNNFSSVIDSNVGFTDNGSYSLAPGKATVVTVDSQYFFPYKKLPVGTYKATYFIVTNDPTAPLIKIPMTFRVE